MEKRPDVIELLEKEKEYHLLQVKRINLAISALKQKDDSITNSNKQDPDGKTIQWTRLIKDLFNKTNEELGLEQIQDELASIGYPEAKSQGGRNAIYTTISRLIRNYNFLEKSDNGRYKRKDGLTGID